MDHKRGIGRLMIEVALAIGGIVLVTSVVTNLARFGSSSPGTVVGEPPSEPRLQDPPWFATKMAIETALMRTREAAPLTPDPRTLWTWTPDARPATATSTPWIVDPHRLASGGWIIWGSGSTYGMICYKSAPEENPYQVVNYWRDIDSPLIVEAGAFGAGRPGSDGAVFTKGDEPCSPVVHRAPFSEGPLEIIDVVGNMLVLRAQSTGRLITFDADSAEFVESVATFTPSPTLTPEGGPRPPERLEDYTLFAVDEIQLGARVSLESGNLGVNDGPDGSRSGELSLGASAWLAPNTTLSADSVSLSSGSRVGGLAFCNDIDVKPGAVLSAPCVSPLVLPVLAIPTIDSLSVDAEAPDLVVPAGEERALNAEEYGKVTVKSEGTLTLLTGLEVELWELILEPGARLECQQACSLRVVSLVRVGPNAYFGTSPWIGPQNFLVEIGRQGGTGFVAQAGSGVAAIVIAPGTGVSLGANGRYMGTFVGKTISVGQGAILYQTAPLGLPTE
jgi:hypothetical protein